MSITRFKSEPARFFIRCQRQAVVAVLSLVTPWMADAQISSADAQAMLEAHNQLRAQTGSGALCMAEQLMQAAENHCQDMATRNFFGHTGSNGSSAGNRIAATGYAFTTWGENIAKGQPSVASVMTAWQNSSGHYKNIVNNGFREVGFARCGSNIWVVDFATSRSGQSTCSTAGGTGGQVASPTAPPAQTSSTDPGLAAYQACQAFTDGWHFLADLNRYRIWWNNSCYQYNPGTRRLSIMKQDAQGLWKFYLTR